MINKDNEKYPKYIQEIIDKAIKEGVDVQVVKINREGNEKELFSTKRKKVLDDIDAISHKIGDIKEQDILDRIAATFKNISDLGVEPEEIYDMVNKLYLKILDNTPVKPKRALGIILGKTPSDVSITGYSFKSKEEAVKVLRAIADGLEDNGTIEKGF